MGHHENDKSFVGSLPQIYQSHLVPLVFEPYAEDMARRLAGRPVRRLLEMAAGTGAVTRKLASTLPARTSIVASDLNQAMLDQAAALGTSRPVDWRRADAMELPFEDGEFDAVVCQFGVMFFPDKPRAFAEARRVLRPGGTLLFNVWDRIEENDFASTITTALADRFPADPPRFLVRTPHGYTDVAAIQRDLTAGGFTAGPRIAAVPARSRAESPEVPAIGYCQGTPLRNEIEARGAALNEVTDLVTEALARQFGRGSVDGKIQAVVVEVER
ncbi:MAG TPA: class I SAM-dependent methyltransferase [Gemmatimonadales bacterium]|nr:class I SAM-dependent methyltransferase [Gemmatimonadales bacterium]